MELYLSSLLNALNFVLQPEGGSQYAISFSYTVKCAVVDVDGIPGTPSETKEVDLSGVVQGLLPGKPTSSAAGGGAPRGQAVAMAEGPMAEEPIVLAQSNDEAETRRNLLMKLMENPY